MQYAYDCAGRRPVFRVDLATCALVNADQWADASAARSRTRRFHSLHSVCAALRVSRTTFPVPEQLRRWPQRLWTMHARLLRVLKWPNIQHIWICSLLVRVVWKSRNFWMVADSQRWHVVAAGGQAPFGAGGEWGGASVVIGEPLAGVRRVRVVGDGGSVALAPIGRTGAALVGCCCGRARSCCILGRLTAHVRVWHHVGGCSAGLQAGVCACGRRLFYKRARDGPSQSLDVPLVPRVPRPMPDGTNRCTIFSTFYLYLMLGPAGSLRTPCRMHSVLAVTAACGRAGRRRQHDQRLLL